MFLLKNNSIFVLLNLSTMKKLFTLLLLFVSLFSFGQEIPENKGYVTDYENLFTEEQNKELTNLLESYKLETTIEIAVLTLPDFEGDVFDLAQNTAEKWGVGSKELNNGLLIVYSKNKNVLRIQTGYGLEAYLPDGWLKPTGDSIKIKYLSQGKYFEGFTELVNKIKERVEKNNYLEENKEVIEKYKKEHKEDESVFVWMLDNIPWYWWIIIIGVWLVILVINPSLAINILLLILTAGRSGGGGKGVGGGKFGGGGSRS